MKILIDIPEEEYKNLAYANHFKLRSYIESGEVLPKGHGRLIDVERLYDDFESMDYDFEDAIEYAPTIIEADKEGKHERMD